MEAIAQSITEDGPAKDALSATTARVIPTGIGDFLGLIRSGQRDVNIVALGDSTTMSVTNAWGLQLATRLAAMFPTHTVKRYQWNYGVSDAYLAADQTFAGTGPRTIHVWLAGAPGQTWNYQLNAARRSIILASNPDLLMLNHGHNTYTSADPESTRRDFAVQSIETLRAETPNAAVVLMSQNPRTDTPGRAEKMADIYRRVAAERGYAFVDVTQAFHDDGRALSVLVNQSETPSVHPTPTGFDVWAEAVMRLFTSEEASAVPRIPAALNAGGRNYCPAPSIDSAWTLTNVTSTRETSATYVRDTNRGFVTRLAKTAGGSSARATVPLPVKRLAGQRITVSVPMYLPAASAATAFQLTLRTSGSAILAASWTDSGLRDQWFIRTITYDVPADATSLVLWVSVDPTTGSDLPVGYVDEVFVTLGAYPNVTAASTASDATVASRFLPAWEAQPYSGVPVLSDPASTSGKVQAWMLDADTTESVAFVVDPSDMNGWSTYNVFLLWAATTGDAGAARWSMFKGLLADDTVPVASTAVNAVTATAGAAWQTKRTILAASVPVESSPMIVRAYRDGTHAADTYPADAAFLGLVLVKAS
ncbi:SGNH/GDSL hydrolase family protein [Microbacterium aurantiacum]|uniref:SGNH/GDSL hydrolase family protein n=1 Tax=Microbacterium aurantiacum TaxID=162393 RepID=A0ABT8FRD5_9MICO|nr:SGNH/GDSL hydrolase family protein [Microbacterium aurantiacum]MDN4463876.1 SGNH/GDSL hydrolase family protein [Microbacterium aurantiacum]